ncbi:hypothetical protein T08_2007 [Trichinella sp. T8]|nr:hypothetical protein T08_2007 [Trichinella sp. T8]
MKVKNQSFEKLIWPKSVICSFLLLHIHISVENIGVKIRSNSDYQLDSFTDPHLFHSSLPHQLILNTGHSLYRAASDWQSKFVLR